MDTINPFENAFRAWIDTADFEQNTILKYLQNEFIDFSIPEAALWIRWYADGDNADTFLEYTVTELIDGKEKHWRVGDFFKRGTLDMEYAKLAGSIPAQLAETGFYALLNIGDDLLENFQITSRQLKAARKMKDLDQLPTPEAVAENPNLMKHYLPQIENIRQASQPPSDVDREKFVEQGLEWLFDAQRQEKQMSKEDAYEIYYNEVSSIQASTMRDISVGCVVGSTVLFDAKGNVVRGPFEVVVIDGRKRSEAVLPVAWLREHIEVPNVKRSKKQIGVMEQIGLDVSVDRRLVYKVEQRILWGLNFMTAFPHYLQHWMGAIILWQEKIENNDQPFVLNVLKDVKLPALDDTFRN